jgi:sugar phosphate isomerase/epimerase
MFTAINQATLMKTPMDDFLNAIGSAGFNGVELRRDETFEFLKTHSVNELKHLLETNKLKVVSWNAIELFSLCPQDEFEGMLDYSERLMKIGNQIGCDLIIAVPSFLDKYQGPKERVMPMTVERFQILRKLASKYSFRMGFEPLGFPTCSVRKIDMALEVLNLAEVDKLPPSGLVIDSFHFFLGEHTPKELEKIPKDRLWLAHFNDCIEKPLNILQDGDRVWPGEGFFDLTGFVNSLRAIKYLSFLSLEIFNPAYWKQDPNVAAKKAYSSLGKFL